MPVTYACPECDAPLKSPRALPAGKKIKCPKCGTVFPVPDEDEEADGAIQEEPRAVAPAARKRARPVVEDEEEEYEDRDDRDEDLDEPDEDRPRRKRSRRPQKAASGGKGMMIGLIIGGAVLLLLLGGGGLGTYLWLNAGKNSGPSNEDPLAYVPADSTVVIGADVGALMEQPGIAAEVEQALQRNAGGGSEFINNCKKETGLEFKDLVHRVIVAVKAPPVGGNPAMVGGPPGMPRPGGMGGPQNQTLIIQSRVPFNQHKIRDSTKDAKAKKLKGKTYYQVNEQTFTTLYMPSNRVIILTSLPEGELEAIIGSNGTQPTFSGDAVSLAQTAREGLFWMVAPVEEQAKQALQQPGIGGALPQMKPLADALKNINAAGFWVVLEGDKLKLHASVVCNDANSARQVADGMQNAWNTQIKGMLPLLALGGLPKEAQTFIKELSDSLQFGTEGATARISAQVSRQALDMLVKLGQQQGQGMRPGGMPGMPGMPPGGMPPGGRPRGGMPPQGRPPG